MSILREMYLRTQMISYCLALNSFYERQIIKTQQSINYYPISSERHVYHSRSIYLGAIWEFTTTLQQFTATVSTDVTPCKATSRILAPVLYSELHFLSSFASVSISFLLVIRIYLITLEYLYSTRNVSPYPNDKLLSRLDSSYERQIIKTQQSINYYPISSELHVYHLRSIYHSWESSMPVTESEMKSRATRSVAKGVRPGRSALAK